MHEPGNDLAPSGGPEGEARQPWSAYEFGAPESVLDRSQIFDMFEVVRGSKWYEPPISPVGLGRAYRMASHHQSAIILKRNMLAHSFVPNDRFSQAEFSRWALDFLIFGNAFLQDVPNKLGGTYRLKTSPAAWTRVGLNEGEHWFVQPGRLTYDPHLLPAGTVHHLLEPDPLQEIYGMPEYLSALQSGLLNENATLFRRRYFLNGAHAGFILHVTDPMLMDADSDALRKALRGAKGPGNFRNLYLHIPGGKPDGVKLVPIAETNANDHFLPIKEVTRDDMLSAHRTPPQLLGIVPKNGTGFGNVIDAARAYYHMEIGPLQWRLQEVNEWLGWEAVKFKEPADMATLLASAAGTKS
ncbi:phage portal protein [Novosphingobium sp.]|uniref:phage portal protein n=1 Tax=Novosphingobium sp. TaxID=1874826 RepID=UPI0031D1433C